MYYGIDFGPCVQDVATGHMPIGKVDGVYLPLAKIPSGDMEKFEKYLRGCRFAWSPDVYQQAMDIARRLFEAGKIIQPAFSNRYLHPVVPPGGQMDRRWVGSRNDITWSAA